MLRDNGEVDSKSSTKEDTSSSFISLKLVEKLALPIMPHPKPYKLQWLSEKCEIVVDRQVYKDDVVYDLVPMEATHTLLGRP
ncbi:hypothetical protein CR513_04742, partial [Mucuna pruriens]